jgi:NAD(P)-dependent dehydrogenase (short-subunit alcohol dehydrogenase family)
MYRKLMNIIKSRVRNKSTYQFSSNATYVIAGGFGGLGRSMCRWMASRGARHLLVISRSGARSEPARQLSVELSELGVNMVAPTCDITQADSLANVLKEYASKLPPIRGCIQCTMVLRVSDDSFPNNPLQSHKANPLTPIPGCRIHQHDI